VTQRRPATETSASVGRARALARRSVREKTGTFLVEGPQGAREALAFGDVVELFVTTGAQERYPDLLDSAQDVDCRIWDVDDDVFAQLSDTVTPQGIAAIARKPVASLAGVAAVEPTLVAILVEAQDPGNVGTVIRIAAAAGAQAVVLTTGSVDPFNPKVVRSTVGAIFHIPIVTGVDFAESAEVLGAAGLKTIATSGYAASRLFDAEVEAMLADPTAWVFGNEARGLPEQVVADCDLALAVPIFGTVESLNLATAAAVCLYSSARQQR